MNIWVDANGWPIPPHILLGCVVVEFLYFRGWNTIIKAIQHPAFARTALPVFTDKDAGEYSQRTWLLRAIFFLCAIFIFLLAASAPIDNLSSRFLWVHMIQHLLLLVVMAPLLVAAAPLLPLWMGLPEKVRALLRSCARLPGIGVFQRIGAWLQQPTLVCILMIVGIWTWHWPTLYDLALTNDAIHDWAEHSTFIAVSLLFWLQVIPSFPLQPRLGYVGRMIFIGISMVQNVVLAVLIGFASAPLYTPYIHAVIAPGSLSALQDQQFGAGIMWTFGDLPFGVALSILIQRWLALHSDDNSVLPSLATPQDVQTEKTAHTL